MGRKKKVSVQNDCNFEDFGKQLEKLITPENNCNVQKYTKNKKPKIVNYKISKLRIHKMKNKFPKPNGTMKAWERRRLSKIYDKTWRLNRILRINNKV